MELRVGSTDQYALLVGRPTISDFVRFIRRKSIEGEMADEVILTREWADARERVRDIESREADWADTEDPRALEARAADYAQKELERSAEHSSLAFLPYQWAMVELDRLVVCQKFINLSFAQQIVRSLPARPTSQELIDIALSNMRTLPAIHATQIDGNSFSFVSASNDMRVLRVTHFDAKNVIDQSIKRNASAVLGVFVGYSANLLRAVRLRNRTILFNGSHRAYALRATGLTHAPCVVQFAREDQLELLGWPELTQNLDRYLTARRPQLFKDYFDERLHRLVSVPRRGLMIQVDVTVKESSVPAF